MKAYGGSGCIDPHFLDLGTSWRWVVSFKLQPPYLQGKGPRYLLYRRLGGLQSRSEQHGEVKILPLRISCSRVLFEKWGVAQLIKKFPVYYGTRMFTIMPTRACHWSPIISEMSLGPCYRSGTRMIYSKWTMQICIYEVLISQLLTYIHCLIN
jgi:hypothetical protein